MLILDEHSVTSNREADMVFDSTLDKVDSAEQKPPCLLPNASALQRLPLPLRESVLAPLLSRMVTITTIATLIRSRRRTTRVTGRATGRRSSRSIALTTAPMPRSIPTSHGRSLSPLHHGLHRFILTTTALASMSALDSIFRNSPIHHV